MEGLSLLFESGCDEEKIADWLLFWRGELPAQDYEWQ